MKNFVYYALLMVLVVIILPLIIVRGCGYSEESDPSIPDKKPVEEVKINVYITSEDQVREMPLEEYVKGVVAAEMPAQFELEALKAQAIAARTYVYGRLKGLYGSKNDVHKGADICTDHAHCQAWKKKEDAMRNWGIFTAYSNWRKIERAVKETKDMIIVYNGKVINPLFHASSCGRTENVEDVWEGKPVDYLRSVPTNGDEESPNYICSTVFKTEDVIAILKNEYPDIECNEKDLFSDIEIIDYTEGGRVKNIRIGNINLKGTDVRKLLSLRSAKFTIEKVDDGNIKITTTGHGHGVGMSQWGANYLAKKGGACEEIIKYYYLGVEITKISEYEQKENI
ncbi:MAG TPA: stage II sporulation protein D [Clostridiaceae bacterium]|nr:stage II sporulation protein D [Clostridiaceae bacterium]